MEAQGHWIAPYHLSGHPKAMAITGHGVRLSCEELLGGGLPLYSVVCSMGECARAVSALPSLS